MIGVRAVAILAFLGTVACTTGQGGGTATGPSPAPSPSPSVGATPDAGVDEEFLACQETRTRLEVLFSGTNEAIDPVAELKRSAPASRWSAVFRKSSVVLKGIQDDIKEVTKQGPTREMRAALLKYISTLRRAYAAGAAAVSGRRDLAKTYKNLNREARRLFTRADSLFDPTDSPCVEELGEG